LDFAGFFFGRNSAAGNVGKVFSHTYLGVGIECAKLKKARPKAPRLV
jgi:hypothetical protein